MRSDLLFLELAPGLEPGTCCLQDSCAADCATPAGGERVSRSGGRRQAAAAADLEQGEGAGDGGVEALDPPGHGDADEHVACLPDQAVQAGAFATDDHADRLVGQLEIEEAR